MRVETVVTQRPWYPFGRSNPGFDGASEKRLHLSERERATLRSAAAIMERARKAVDPDDLDDIRISQDMRVLAMGETYTSEAAEADYFLVVEGGGA